MNRLIVKFLDKNLGETGSVQVADWLCCWIPRHLFEPLSDPADVGDQPLQLDGWLVISQIGLELDLGVRVDVALQRGLEANHLDPGGEGRERLLLDSKVRERGGVSVKAALSQARPGARAVLQLLHNFPQLGIHSATALQLVPALSGESSCNSRRRRG